MDQGHDAPAVQRRKRKVARQTRDKTPEPRATGRISDIHKYSDDESSSTTTTTTMPQTPQLTPTTIQRSKKQQSNVDDTGNMTIQSRVQSRPVGTMSAHESKILRRRNHGLANAAARSQSQPRTDSNTQTEFCIRNANGAITIRRSLSSTRHQDDELDQLSSESTGQLSSPTETIQRQYSPLFELQRRTATGDQIDGEKISKLERNLQRFENERMKFEMEKKKYDREKRELHKIRYRQMLENEERRRMLLSHRKSSGDRTGIPSDSDDYRHRQQQQQQQQQHSKVVQSGRETKKVPVQQTLVQQDRLQKSKKYREYETTSSISDSDSDMITRRRTSSRDSENRHQAKHQNGHVKSQTQNNSHQRQKEPATTITVRRRNATSNDKFEEAETSHRKITPPLRKSQTPPIEEAIIAPQQDKIKLLSELKVTNGIHSDAHKETTTTTAIVKQEIPIETKNFFFRFFSIFKRTPKVTAKSPEEKIDWRIFFKWSFIKLLLPELLKEWRQMKIDHPAAILQIRLARNKCFAHFLILIMLVGFGGLMFRFTEGTFENIFKCEIRKVKRDFIDNLWLASHRMREDDWKTEARNKLRRFEEEVLAISDSGIRYTPAKWNFLNSVIYCFTLITAIGYGHIYPKTSLGRTLTIVYAIIGIPMFLILLADFGKLFTRCIKFVWAYIRRVYYTGTCRKVRKNQQMQDMMKGINAVYDVAIRRPSLFIRDLENENPEKKSESTKIGTTLAPPPPESPSSVTIDVQNGQSQIGTDPATPTSPYPETFEVDDEFNLPISVATAILILYIICGALLYPMWENWTYFESFYFVFISMSTIGFGDYVPQHPIFMMCTIIYLMFGMALTSMFINVVQIKLSDSFKQASAKIGATIGLSMAEEEMSRNSQLTTPVNETPVVQINGQQQHAPANKSSGDYDGVKKLIIPPPLLPRTQNVPSPHDDEQKQKKRLFNLANR